jgi:hypothetical protein
MAALLTTIDSDTSNLGAMAADLGTIDTDTGNIATALGSGALTTAAGADGVSNTNATLETTSNLMAFNGTTWDRLPGDDEGGLIVQGEIADNAALGVAKPVHVGGKIVAQGTESQYTDNDAFLLQGNEQGALLVDIRDGGRLNKTASVTGTGSTEIAAAPAASTHNVLEYLHVQNAAATATEMNILSASTNKFKFRLGAEDGYGITCPVRGLQMAAAEAMNIKAETSTTYYYFAIWRTVKI